MAKLLSFIFLLILPLATAGQKATPQTEARKQLTDRLINGIIAEVPSLALAENRSYVYARLGQIVCRSDRQRAGVMLQLSSEELVRVRITANSRPLGRQAERLAGYDNQLRRAILMTAAWCSADTALQMFYASRPPAVEKAISTPPEYKDVNGVSTLVQNRTVQAEKELERILLRMSAEQDPTREMETLIASVKGPLATATLGYLRRIFSKDPDKGLSLATETVDRLMRESFESNGKPVTANVNLGTAILIDHTRPRRPNVSALTFDEAQMRSLLSKLVSYHTAMRSSARAVRNLIPIADKLSPVAASQLRALEESSRASTRSNSRDPEVRRLLEKKAPPAVAVEEAKKLQPASRREFANAAAREVVGSGSYEQALGVLHSLIEDEGQLADAVNALNWFYAQRLMNEAKFTEAEQLIDTFPDGSRQSGLIALGGSIFRKDRVANKDKALGILNRARTQLTQSPDTTTEYTTLAELMRMYLMMDPNAGFQVMEPVTVKLSELWRAAVVMAAYNNMPNFRQGEFIFATQPPPGFRFDWTLFRLYANTNLEKTIALAESIQNRDMRIYLKLQIAEIR